MSTIADLVAAAAELNVMELKELRLEIQRLEHRRPGKRFNLKEFAIGLTRLEDGAYMKLRRSSIAIKDDNMFLVQLLYPIFSQTKRQAPLNFGELYFVMEHLYGESSLLYDDYKSSFLFPFALDVIKEDKVYPYLIIFRDCRGSLEFSVYKCVRREEIVDSTVCPPQENEFSRTEINSFVAYFYGYLQGHLQMFLASGVQPMPFVKRQDFCHCLYGYYEGQFFEDDYDRKDKFEQAYRRLIAKLDPSASSSNNKD
jgi:hypothetical protein